MTILITAPGEYIADADEPVLGRRYTLEDATCGTGAQNRLFHAILGIYYTSGAWSYSGSGYKGGATYTEFRNHVKRKLGAGYDAFVYVDPEENPPVIHDVKTREEIPRHVPIDLIRGRLRSWADYTKKQRRDTIDNLLAEMAQVGVQSPQLIAILDELDEAFRRKHDA